MNRNFFAILLRAQPEIAIGAGQKIGLQPFLVIFQRGRGCFLQRLELLFHFRRADQQRIETDPDEIDRALGLLDSRLGMNAGRMLQIFLGLLDYVRNRFHPLAQIRDPLFRRIVIAGNNKIEAVGQALVIDERVPDRFPQFFQREDFTVDVVAQNLHVHLIRAGELRRIVKLLERLAKLFRADQQPIARLRRVIGQQAVKTMVAQFRGVFRMRRQKTFDVILGDLFKFLILGIGAGVEDRQRQQESESRESFSILDRTRPPAARQIPLPVRRHPQPAFGPANTSGLCKTA